MGHDLGVGLGRKHGAAAHEFGAQLGKILDDAVMHDGDAVGGVGMGVDLVGPAMGGPAGMADAAMAAERFAGEAVFEILQLAFGAAAREHAVLQGGDTGRIIAAIFEPLERIHHGGRHRSAAENSDDAAHAVVPAGLCSLLDW